MSSRLIIDGNSVYEIDEDCEESRFGRRAGTLSGPCGQELAGREIPEAGEADGL